MYFTKSSKTTNTNSKNIFNFDYFQYLQVQIDSQGNLVKIVNLNKSISLPFTNQGLYWYEGMSITKILIFLVSCSNLRSY